MLECDGVFRAYMFFPGRDHRIFVQQAEDKTAAEVRAALDIAVIIIIGVVVVIVIIGISIITTTTSA